MSRCLLVVILVASTDVRAEPGLGVPELDPLTLELPKPGPQAKPVPKRPKPASAPSFATEAAAGLSLSSRKLRIDGGPEFVGSPAAGVAVSAAIRLPRHGVALVADLDRSLAARVELAQNGSTMTVPFTQQRWAIGLTNTVTVGGVQLIARGGYDELAYRFATRETALPAARYGYVDLGAGLRVSVLRGVAFAVRLRYLHVLALQQTGYGDVHASGWDGDAGVELEAGEHLVVRAAAHYLRMSLAHADLGTAVDHYYGFHLMVGVTL